MNEQQEQKDVDVSKLLSALKPSWHNKGYYLSRPIKQTERVTVFAEDGTPIETEVSFFINWESIKQVLTLVQIKADILNDKCFPPK